MVLIGHETLNGLMFGNSLFSPFKFGFVSSKASVRQPILDVVVIHLVFKWEVFEFIERRLTKNCIVMCESHQDWFNFFVMYKTCMPHDNVIKKVR